jgi:hypothetical protein
MSASLHLGIQELLLMLGEANSACGCDHDEGSLTDGG